MKLRSKFIVLITIIALLGIIIYYYHPDILGYHLLNRARQSYEPIVKTGDYFTEIIELNPFHRSNPFYNSYFNPFDQRQYILQFQYPVAALASCPDQLACASYCQQNENISQCAQFAYDQGLIDQSKLNKAAKLAKMFKEGRSPGECPDLAACEIYCNQLVNLDNCVDISRLSGLVSASQLQDAERINQAIVFGLDLPGGCFSQSNCESYCAQSSKMQDCLYFAEVSGFLSQIEINDAKKLISFYQQKQTPGSCQTKNQCLDYCLDKNNVGECVNFLENNNLISVSEAKLSRTYQAKGPAGCWTRESCDTYCSHPANLDSCLAYAIKVGEIDEKELEIINRILAQDRNKPFDFVVNYFKKDN